MSHKPRRTDESKDETPRDARRFRSRGKSVPGGRGEAKSQPTKPNQPIRRSTAKSSNKRPVETTTQTKKIPVRNPQVTKSAWEGKVLEFGHDRWQQALSTLTLEFNNRASNGIFNSRPRDNTNPISYHVIEIRTAFIKKAWIACNRIRRTDAAIEAKSGYKIVPPRYDDEVFMKYMTPSDLEKYLAMKKNMNDVLEQWKIWARHQRLLEDKFLENNHRLYFFAMCCILLSGLSTDSKLIPISNMAMDDIFYASAEISFLLEQQKWKVLSRAPPKKDDENDGFKTPEYFDVEHGTDLLNNKDSSSSSISNLYSNFINNNCKFYNISNSNIPKNIVNILNKGLNYVLQKFPKKETMIQDLKDIEIQLYSKGIVQSDLFIKNEINILTNKVQKSLYNISGEFTQASDYKIIKEFLDKEKLILKPADKNLGLVIMPWGWYDNSIMSHLRDVNYYIEQTPNFVNILNELDLIHKRINRTNPFQIELDKLDLSIPEFYILPKIHKNPVKIRPIVPSFAWITTEVSKYLHAKFLPYVKSIKWIANNSIDVINILDDFKIYTKPVLCGIDVEAMYTNIDIEEGVKCVKNILVRLGCPPNHTKYYCELLTWVLKNSFFKYQNTWYHQIRGTAMGTNLAPMYANLFLANYEYGFVEKLQGQYIRYLDDILFISDSRETTIALLEKLDGLSTSLKFTHEIKSKISFLDLEISAGEKFRLSNHLDYCLFEKAEKVHWYTSPDSNCADHIKFGWITGENIRILRNSCTKREFKKSMNLFKLHLNTAKYRESITKKFIRYKYHHRSLFLPRKAAVTDKQAVVPIVFQSSWLEKDISEFIHKVSKRYNTKLTPVISRYLHLEDQLNRITKSGFSSFPNGTS